MRIVSRYDSSVVLYEGKAKSLRDLVETAVRSGADLRGADLSGADLNGANLNGANLRGANLRGANLCRTGLHGADLRGADLRGAYLRGANLRRADFSGADLNGADLNGADLRGADLSGAYLCWAYLRGAYLRGAKVDGGPIAGIVGTDALLAYVWTAYRMEDGSVRLRYGCEEHDLAEWPDLVESLCEEHAKDDERYPPALRALIGYVEGIADVACPAPEREAVSRTNRVDGV